MKKIKCAAISLLLFTLLVPNNANVSQNAVKKQQQVNQKWFNLNPLLINVSSTFDFDTSSTNNINDSTQYSYDNPNYNPIQPKYQSDNGIGVQLYVNISYFIPTAYDSTTIGINLQPATGFFSFSDLIANGGVNVYFRKQDQLPDKCYIYNSNTKIKTLSSFFSNVLFDGNIEIKGGIFMYRYLNNGVSTPWANYAYLDNLTDSNAS